MAPKKPASAPPARSNTETDDRSWLDEWINPIFCDAWSTLTEAYRARPFPIRS